MKKGSKKKTEAYHPTKWSGNGTTTAHGEARKLVLPRFQSVFNLGNEASFSFGRGLGAF